MDWNPEARGTCGDCGVQEGEFHRPGCDMEICPFCAGQLIGCGCCYEHLEIDCSEGTWAYKHGLTPEQFARWNTLLQEKGRIRFVRPVVLCARCGKTWPQFFRAQDWKTLIPQPYRDEVLCRRCYAVVRSFMLDAIRAER